MNPVYAFALGFVVAAVVTAIFAVNIARAMIRDAREIGYEDGYDAGRAGARRELSDQAKEVTYSPMWQTMPGGERRRITEAEDF